MAISLGDSAIPVLIIAILAIPIFLLTLFPLMSCARTSLENIYLASSVWNESNNPVTTLRIGYYGLCWKDIPNGAGGTFDRCIGTTARSAKSISQAMFGSDNDIFHDSVQAALDLQRKVFVAFMTVGGLVWLLSLVLVALFIFAKGNSSSSWRIASTWTALVGAVLMLVSAWSTPSAVRALEVVGTDITGGNLLIGLQWVAAILSCVYAWAVNMICKQEGKSTVYNYNIGR